jgi:SAM-dependent methyltransferase
MPEFDSWADLYDIVHSGLPGEAEYYVEAAKRAVGDVLELGCGTGRVAIPIAASGISTTGLDLSRPMLDQCVKKWSGVCVEHGYNDDGLTLIQGDMTTFDLGRRFPLIVMPYRSFMHLRRSHDQLNCLERVAAHLEDDGRFIMNIWVPATMYIYAFGAAQDEPEYNHVDTYDAPDSEGTLEHYHTVHCDEFNQQMIEDHLFITKNRTEDEVSRKSLPLVRTWIGVREMANLIEASSLEVESVFGDFDESPLGAMSTESIWVLKRRKN